MWKTSGLCRGFTGVDTETVLEQVQQFASLGKSLDLPIQTYSSGMKARLAFGLSLAISFECYLIDEVTAVGDRRFKSKSKRALKDKIKDARVVMISHSERPSKTTATVGCLPMAANCTTTMTSMNC